MADMVQGVGSGYLYVSVPMPEAQNATITDIVFGLYNPYTKEKITEWGPAITPDDIVFDEDAGAFGLKLKHDFTKDLPDRVVLTLKAHSLKTEGGTQTYSDVFFEDVELTVEQRLDRGRDLWSLT